MGERLALAKRDLAALVGTRRSYALALAATLEANLHLLERDAEAYVIWSLERAMPLCDEGGLVMQREATRYCLGQTLGGEAGDFEQRRALAALSARREEPARADRRADTGLLNVS